MNIHTLPAQPTEPEKPKEPKLRIITLTHRAPIRIVEDDWPVIAKAGWGSNDFDGPPWGWSLEMRVRRHVDAKRAWCPGRTLYIVHGKYHHWDETEDDGDRLVRLGRTLTGDEAQRDLYKHILEVGDELRERIPNQDFHKHVTRVIDELFADMKPNDIS